MVQTRDQTHLTGESSGIELGEAQANRHHQSSTDRHLQVQTHPQVTISTTCLAIIYSYLHTQEIHASLVVAKSWTLDETGSELLRHLLREQFKPSNQTTTSSSTVQEASLDELLQLNTPPTGPVHPQMPSVPPLTPYQSIQRTAFDPIGSIELLQKAAADLSLGPFNLSYERLPWRQQSSWIRYSLMNHRIIRLHATSIPFTSSALGGCSDLLGSSGVLVGTNEIWNGIHHQVLHVYLDQANEAKTHGSGASTQLKRISDVLQWLQSSCSNSGHPSAAGELESLESRLIVLTVIDDKVESSHDLASSSDSSLSNEPPLTLAFSAGKFGPSPTGDASLSYMMAQTTPTDLLFHSLILTSRHQSWCTAFLTRIITDISLAHPAPTNEYLHAFSFIGQFYCYQSALPTGRTKNDSTLEFIASILDLCATAKEVSFLGTLIVPRPIQFQFFYLDLAGGTDIVKCMSKCLFPYHSSIFCHLTEIYLLHLTGVFPSVSFGGQKFDQSRVFDQAFARALSAPTEVTNQFPKVGALFMGGDTTHGGCYLDDATLRVMSGSFQFIRQIELFNLQLDDVTTLFRSYRSLTHLNISDCSILEDDGEMDSRAPLLATRTLRYQELEWSQLPTAILRQLKLRWKRIQPSLRSSLHLYSVLSLIMFVLLLLTDAGSIWTLWTLFSPNVRWFEWMAFFMVVLYGLPYTFYLVFSGGSHQDTCGQVNKSAGYQILGPSVAISLAYFGPILVQEWKTTLWLNLNTLSWCLLLPLVTLYLSYYMCHQFYNSHLRPHAPLNWPMTVYRLQDYLILTPLKLFLTGLSFNWILPRLSTVVWDVVHFDGFSMVQLIEFYASRLLSTLFEDPPQFWIPSFVETAMRFFTIYYSLLTLPIVWQMMIMKRIRKTS